MNDEKPGVVMYRNKYVSDKLLQCNSRPYEIFIFYIYILYNIYACVCMCVCVKLSILKHDIYWLAWKALKKFSESKLEIARWLCEPASIIE